MELLRPLADADFPADSDTTGAVAVSLGPWNAGPQGVVVWCTEDVYVTVGSGVTATNKSTPIPAYTPIPFTVPPEVSGTWVVSALQVLAAGTVFAKPINIR